MWNLVVYEILPWESLVHVLQLGSFRDLGDCMVIYSQAVKEISQATDLMGTYIPMCVRAL